MNQKLKDDILYILTYFKKGLDDVQEGCDGEPQPMQKEIKSALSRLKKVATKSKKQKKK